MLLGGIWTFPAGGDVGGMASVTVALGEGEIRGDVNFGWDYREPATPTAPSPTETPVPSGETPTPTLTLTPTPTTSATDPRVTLGDPTWRDAFDSGGNWPLYADGHVQFEVHSGSLVMTAFNADYWDGWMLTYPVITDLYLEMSATPAIARARIGTASCSGPPIRPRAMSATCSRPRAMAAIHSVPGTAWSTLR